MSAAAAAALVATAAARARPRVDLPLPIADGEDGEGVGEMHTPCSPSFVSPAMPVPQPPAAAAAREVVDVEMEDTVAASAVRAPIPDRCEQLIPDDEFELLHRDNGDPPATGPIAPNFVSPVLNKIGLPVPLVNKLRTLVHETPRISRVQVQGYVSDLDICALCNQVLHAPVCWADCAHKVCGPCFLGVAADRSKSKPPRPLSDCQICNLHHESLAHVMLDVSFSARLREMCVACPYRCVRPGTSTPFVMDLGIENRVYNGHIAKCTWRPVECHDCHDLVTASMLAEHRAALCPRRTFVCPHCAQEVCEADRATHITANGASCSNKHPCPSKCKPCHAADYDPVKRAAEQAEIRRVGEANMTTKSHPWIVNWRVNKVARTKLAEHLEKTCRARIERCSECGRECKLFELATHKCNKSPSPPPPPPPAAAAAAGGSSFSAALEQRIAVLEQEAACSRSTGAGRRIYSSIVTFTVNDVKACDGHEEAAADFDDINTSTQLHSAVLTMKRDANSLNGAGFLRLRVTYNYAAPNAKATAGAPAAAWDYEPPMPGYEFRVSLLARAQPGDLPHDVVEHMNENHPVQSWIGRLLPVFGTKSGVRPASFDTLPLVLFDLTDANLVDRRGDFCVRLEVYRLHSPPQRAVVVSAFAAAAASPLSPALLLERERKRKRARSDGVNNN